MSKRSLQRSNASIPFAVFAVLIITVVGVFLHNRMGGGSAEYVLGVSTTQDAPLFSREWFNNILTMFGLGSKTTTPERTYALPTYGDSSGSSEGLLGNTDASNSVTSDDPDLLMSDLGTTNDDGGETDFQEIKVEASGL